MSLRLYDTATREVRDFLPSTPGEVGVYLCGATVQAPPHIGHLRSGVAFDVLRRWLEAGHGYRVTFIRNVTDIDDKILTKSAEAGVPWWAWAYTHEQAFTDAYDALGVRRPSYEPRATGHITEMLELVELLLERGHAYVAEDGSGDVYFDVRSFAGYGDLTHQRPDDMAPAEDADPRGKRDPRDFALWKGWKTGEPATASWPTPYGRGRPGWHLECSAMARKYLGDTFDIHAGGVDLRFPHHENEQAQSRAAGLGFARYWLHNAWVTIGGEKMSKSLGNSLVVAEILRETRPLALRYYLGQAHYRSTIEWTPTSLQESEAAVRRFERALERARALLSPFGDSWWEKRGESGEIRKLGGAAFADAMDSDLAVPAALAELHHQVRQLNQHSNEAAHRDLQDFRSHARLVMLECDVLGVNPLDSKWVKPGQRHSAVSEAAKRKVLGALVRSQLDERAKARANKDFAAADAIRSALVAAGIAVEDTADGARWSLADPQA